MVWSVEQTQPRVVSVAADATHRFSKVVQPSIRLIAGEGVEGDAHRGVTVKHRSRVRQDPTQPNLRQVHLIHSELIEALVEQGFDVGPGVIGENILTAGLDILALPVGSVIAIGTAEIEVTGLRNPCAQLDNYQQGLTAAVLDRAPDGSLIRKSGIMGMVRRGGDVAPGMEITVTLPAAPWRRMDRV